MSIAYYRWGSQRLLFNSCIRVRPSAVLRIKSSYHHDTSARASESLRADGRGHWGARSRRGALSVALSTRGAGFGGPRGLAGRGGNELDAKRGGSELDAIFEAASVASSRISNA